MFLSDKLMERVKLEGLPFHAVTGQNLAMPRPGDPDPPRTGKFSSPDALLTSSDIAEAVNALRGRRPVVREAMAFATW